ncbi:MAG: hypothetical protein AB2421_20865 [Thermotaleaceae bacterium]
MAIQSIKEAANGLSLDEKIELIVHLLGECETDLPNDAQGNREFENYLQDLDVQARCWQQHRRKQMIITNIEEVA